MTTLVLFLKVFIINFIICYAEILNDKKCDKFDTKPLTASERAAMNTWHIPGTENVEGESLYGFAYVFKKIYENQNPVDCKTAKFVVYPGYESGFGSTVRVEGNFLAVALDIGRVLVQPPVFDPNRNGQSLWRFYSPLCQNKEDNNSYVLNMYCYFEPYTKCSYSDIFPNYNPKDPTSWDLTKIPVYKFKENEVPKSVEENKVIENERVVRFEYDYIMTQQLPQVSAWRNDLFSCFQLPHAWEQTFWWAAVTSAYLMRPNR